MDSFNYEPHIHEDPSFPIIFHLSSAQRSGSFFIHWHESIEILFIVEGSVVVISDTNQVTAAKGDIAVINSGNIHNIKSIDEISKYYCLIIDKKLCEEFGLYIEELVFQRQISDETARSKFDVIRHEMLSKMVLYKSAVKSAIIDFLIYLYRNYILNEAPWSKHVNIKINIIKQSIKYHQDNHHKDISPSDIAREIGLSESYFCRAFKEITGYTAMHYLNHIRCTNAKKLLQTGTYTVGEAALSCGYNNFSYFSKTYKKHIGYLPSECRINKD